MTQLYLDFSSNIDFQNAQNCQNIKTLSLRIPPLLGEAERKYHVVDFYEAISLAGSLDYCYCSIVSTQFIKIDDSVMKIVLKVIGKIPV